MTAPKNPVVAEEAPVGRTPLWEFPIKLEKQVGMVFAGSGRLTPVEAALAQIGRIVEVLDEEDGWPTDGTFRFTLPEQASPTQVPMTCEVQVKWSGT